MSASLISNELTKLIVIDMQAAFRDNGSPWQFVGYEEAAAQAERLTKRASGEVVWTRFVRDPVEHGSRSTYYEHWTTFRVAEDAAQWDIKLVTKSTDEVITLPTFGKWGDQLAELTADYSDLLICGVATECCVLSAVLPAIDAGKRVTVVTDACAGATTQLHDQALAVLESLAPMVNLTTTDELLGD